MARPVRRLPRFAVIMAGGQGTRFWPLARRSRPKQFLPARGDRSFLQEAVRRILPLFGWDRILIVTAAEHADAVARDLPALPATQILGEPVGRNTAACLALAAEWIATHVGEAVIVALPADHVVHDGAGFRRSLRRAVDVATEHRALVVIGVEPTRAETGYGYIEAGAELDAAGDVRWVRRFHEKPDLRTARRYVRSGRHRWNAGIFVWRTSVFAAALDQCAREFGVQLRGVFAADARAPERIAKAYAHLPSVPIDISLLQAITAIADPVARVAVVAAGFDWMDAGSWEAMAELWGADADGNTTRGEVVAIDSSGCIVIGGERPVVLVGGRDLIVVDAEDALLVCPREHAQAVRLVPGELVRRKLDRFV